MDNYDVKRFALVLAVQADIEGMKAKNKERQRECGDNAWGEENFDQKAEELRNLAYCHNEQL